MDTAASRSPGSDLAFILLRTVTGAEVAEAKHGMRLERCQAASLRIPEEEDQEQKEERPLQITTPDHLLDTVTASGNHFGDRIEEAGVVIDRLGFSDEEKHVS